MDQPGQNESKHDPAPGTTTVELTIETGEKRPLKAKLSDCFGWLFSAAVGFVLFLACLNYDFNKSEKWTNTAAVYFGIIFFPILGIASIISFFYKLFGLFTKRTIYQEKQMDNKMDEWQEKYSWPVLKWGCLSILIVVGIVIGLFIFLYVFEDAKKFFDKTPGWALIIIGLLVFLIIKVSDKKR